MNAPNVADLELHIARVRIVLSVVAVLSIYVDPTTPDLASWMPLITGAFSLSSLAQLAYLPCSARRRPGGSGAQAPHPRRRLESAPWGS